MTNSYIIYKKYLLLQNITPMSHYEFQNVVAKICIRSDLHWPDASRKRARQGESNTQDNVSVASSTINNLHVSSHTLTSKIIATPFTDKTLYPYTGVLIGRLYGGDHWAVPSNKKDARCQLHYWATRRKCRSQLLIWNHFKVTICAKCFAPYHTIKYLVGSKNFLRVRCTTEDEYVN